MSKTIELTKGKVTVVDNADYDFLNQFSWHTQEYKRREGSTFYALRNIPRSQSLTGRRTTETMHHLLLGVSLVDHRDGDGLNNQRTNLREALTSGNMQNRYTNFGTSKFKGVSWDLSQQGWRADICYDKSHHYLGLFKTEIEAAQEYDFQAVKHHGEFARTNAMMKLYPEITLVASN